MSYITKARTHPIKNKDQDVRDTVLEFKGQQNSPESLSYVVSKHCFVFHTSTVSYLVNFLRQRVNGDMPLHTLPNLGSGVREAAGGHTVSACPQQRGRTPPLPHAPTLHGAQAVPSGLPTPAPPARSGLGSSRGAQATAGKGNGKRERGGNDDPPWGMVVRSPKDRDSQREGGQGKAAERPFSYRGLLRNHGNGAQRRVERVRVPRQRSGTTDGPRGS